MFLRLNLPVFVQACFQTPLKFRVPTFVMKTHQLNDHKQDFTKPYPLSLMVMICEFNLQSS
jgi:hypothetical protein